MTVSRHACFVTVADTADPPFLIDPAAASSQPSPSLPLPLRGREP